MDEITAFGDILTGDALAVLRTLPDQSVQCCVTSPPYWGLRDYGVPGQIGLEATPREYVAALLPIFHEVHRVLRADGTLWLNLGDSYIGYHGNKMAHGSAAPSDKNGYRENMRPTSVGADGLKNKDMAGIPWRVAFALQDAGWYLRCDCIWAKPNPMPESVRDRPTRAHEYLFLFSKSERYYYDHEAVREPAVASNKHDYTGQGGYQPPGQPTHKGNRTRAVKRHSVRPGVDTKGGNQGRGEITYPPYTRSRRSVWSVATHPFPDAHFATFPPALIRPCVLAGCPAGGVVLDPFFGAGTVGVVCVEGARRYLGIELNPDYVAMASDRIAEAEMKAQAPKQASLLQLERAI
ncbi:DNA methylase [Desulfovibrio sp. 6_1_46AFAA]|uniref:DNA-methyltransferase n=1 Tax=Desulfovibrio sp. 6_1_46AFAA TaxID=665942 RepID=UPI0002236D55|nr:site-specific DNA-methyltransferase [Desulfovibrio sp. 6_1_46AFAA]EGW50076.1 DNA methylase [Desulfovibrio sp. 6_1_46AFAA]